MRFVGLLVIGLVNEGGRPSTHQWATQLYNKHFPWLGSLLLKRWYALNKDQVDLQIADRLFKEAEKRREQQEELRYCNHGYCLSSSLILLNRYAYIQVEPSYMTYMSVKYIYYVYIYIPRFNLSTFIKRVCTRLFIKRVLTRLLIEYESDYL